MSRPSQASSGAVTDDLVLRVVRGAVGRVLELDPDSVRPELTLPGDLGADSLALVEIVEIVEEELAPYAPGFTIDDDEIEDLVTIADAVAYVTSRVLARS